MSIHNALVSGTGSGVGHATASAWNALERSQDAMTDHKVVGRAEWQAAREELLRREKEHTRMGDELSRVPDGLYPILDRTPKGRDEGDGWQLWLRRHDEYGSE